MRLQGRKEYGMIITSIYEKDFSTPEKVALYVIDNCQGDCYECPFAGFPCYETFGCPYDCPENREEMKKAIVDYLNRPIRKVSTLRYIEGNNIDDLDAREVFYNLH